jgi:hypothetical protein
VRVNSLGPQEAKPQDMLSKSGRLSCTYIVRRGLELGRITWECGKGSQGPQRRNATSQNKVGCPRFELSRDCSGVAQEEPIVVTVGTKREADEFDLEQDRHKGQFALRKLYHESERLVVVMYTSPTCGPCRTLKPIFNKVVDEFPKQVRPHP